MSKRCIVAAIILATNLATNIAHAQDATETPGLSAGDAVKQEAKAPDAVQEPPKTAEPTAPYDDKMLRLAEVLGSIHYLRALCGANEGTKWRDTMRALIASEKPGPKRRARLVARFNRGYSSFDGTYGNCTDSALLAADRYRKEGVLLSSQITTRYGR